MSSVEPLNPPLAPVSIREDRRGVSEISYNDLNNEIPDWQLCYVMGLSYGTSWLLYNVGVTI